MSAMNENDISHVIYECAIEAHRTLGGPGLLEVIYEEALASELCDHQMSVGRQVAVPVRYKGKTLATPLRIDMLVGEKVIVECKSVVEYNPIYEAQALTYLRLTGLKLALVINFGEQFVSRGIHRVVNGLQDVQGRDAYRRK